MEIQIEPLDLTRRFKQIILDERTVDDMLAKNTNNRRLDQSAVESYARQMREGSWSWGNLQSVLFTMNESMTWLLDGQTRLHAIKKSGAFGRSALVDLVPDAIAERVFKVLDTGRARKTSQTLRLLGYAAAAEKSAVARILLNLCKCTYDPASVREFVERKNVFLEQLPLKARHARTGVPVPAGYFAGMINAVRLGLCSAERVFSFADEVIKDGPSTSANLLSSHVIRNKGTNGGHLKQLESFVVATKMAHAFAEGRKAMSIHKTNADVERATIETPSPWNIPDFPACAAVAGS